jgi:hypothetical protein
VDPAPVYNGKNFTATLDFVELMLMHNRSVVYYPETSYWCNYDTSVPLFLPVYALSRITDMQLLRGVEARVKQRGGARLRGQFVWESGWMWGYWLPTIVAVRSHWVDLPAAEPETVSSQSPELLKDMLIDIFGSITGSVAEARQLAESIRDIAVGQRDSFIGGHIPGQVAPKNVERANAFAYMIGTDGIADLLQFLHDAKLINATTQPHRLPYRELMHRGNHADALAEYKSVVGPLMNGVTDQLARLGSNLRDALQSPIAGQPSNPLLLDLRDSMALLQLRSQQVQGLYEYAACRGPWPHLLTNCGAHLAQAETALSAGFPLVHAQEQRYGLFAQGSARLWAYGRDVNPSGYGRGHYWTVHSLYYWRRDQEIVTKGVFSPCFMSINDALELYLGDGATGIEEALAHIAKDVLQRIPFVGALSDCLVPESHPPALFV